MANLHWTTQKIQLPHPISSHHLHADAWINNEVSFQGRTRRLQLQRERWKMAAAWICRAASEGSLLEVQPSSAATHSLPLSGTSDWCCDTMQAASWEEPAHTSSSTKMEVASQCCFHVLSYIRCWAFRWSEQTREERTKCDLVGRMLCFSLHQYPDHGGRLYLAPLPQEPVQGLVRQLHALIFCICSFSFNRCCFCFLKNLFFFFFFAVFTPKV